MGLCIALGLMFGLSACGKKGPSYLDTGTSKSQGFASWYGKRFHGRRTANGETYDMYQPTAAHRTLPFGTRVRVRNLDNGKSTIVRINDRGPFIRGRIIDVSYSAARALGLDATGTARVRLEILGKEPRTARHPPAPPKPAPPPQVKEKVSEGPPLTTENVVQTAPQETPSGGYFVQLGSFRAKTNAERFLNDLQEKVGITPGSVQMRSGLHRVWVGPVQTHSEAVDLAAELKSQGFAGFVLRR